MQGIRSGLNSARYAYKAPESAVDYLIIGGGVVGLAIARSLSQFSNKSTILVERHTRAGEETSSRNSEVIHSGLYYPPDSLKTRLCIRGRELLYSRCKSYNIPFRKTGKLVPSSAKAQKLDWPSTFITHPDQPALRTQLLSGADARRMEPNLSSEIAGALWCPETGIIDSHALMESLEKDIIDSDGGDLVYSTRVVRVDPYSQTTASPDLDGASRGWVVQMVTGEHTGEGDAIFTRTLINATGLSAPLIVNSLLPEAKRIPLFYARGSYATYSGPGISGVSHLIYPCPETEGNAAWLPSQKDSRLEEMHRAVSRYLPEVTLEGLQPDYVGIRPKLVGPQGGFQDFVFRTDYPDTERESQHRPLISLLGIESPGLTASLAIAEHVVEDMLGDVHGGR
ncbi:NAD dehydrogenase [Mycena vulgaris]|nr:NAD dehydrogenase [Mycena vulgaris]